MTHPRTSVLIVLLVTLVIAAGAAHVVFAREGIGQVTVTARPESFNGTCPAHIHFSARIEIDKYPLSLNYEWIRSDGAKGPLKTWRAPSSGTRSLTATDSWTLGQKGEHIEVWEKIRVRSGNTDITSDSVTVSITCR